MAAPVFRNILFLCLAVSPFRSTFAEDKKSDRADENETVTRLETLLEAQQRRIEQLENKILAVEGKNDDTARADQMRQQIREILSEKEFRESLMPSTVTSGYDNGFYIRSTDEKFLMKTNGNLQVRWTHYNTQASNHYLSPNLQRNDRTGFDVQRVRLKFTGFAYDKNLTYEIEFSGDAPNQNQVRTHYAWFNYRFMDEFQIRAGLFRLDSTRAQVTSDTRQHFIDRPPEDVVFGLDRGVGVRFWGQLFQKRLDYFVDVVNSLNAPGNITITNDPSPMDSNPAVLFRTVWHALGEDPEKDFLDMSDIPPHQSPALDLGFHYAFDANEGDTTSTRIVYARAPSFLPGGFALSPSTGLQTNQFGLDTGFKWRGFSLVGEYMMRIVDVRRSNVNPITTLYLLDGDNSTTVQYGGYVSMGYFLPIPGLENKLEAVARVGGITTNAGHNEGTWEYAAGLNYYLQGNKVKIQADVTKISEVPISNNQSSMANVNDDALVFRVQLQVGF